MNGYVMEEDRKDLEVMDYLEKKIRNDFDVPSDQKIYYINKMAKFYCRMQGEEDYLTKIDVETGEGSVPVLTFGTKDDGDIRLEFPADVTSAMVAVVPFKGDESQVAFMPLNYEFSVNLTKIAYQTLRDKKEFTEFLEFMKKALPTRKDLEPDFAWINKMKYFMVEMEDKKNILEFERINHSPEKKG